MVTHLESIHRKIERATSINSIGYSVNKEKIHPTVQSYFLLSIAMLKFFEGKMNEFNVLSKESLGLVKRTSPRYFKFIINFASLISLQGRLNEFDKEDLDILNSPFDEESAILCIDRRNEIIRRV